MSKDKNIGIVVRSTGSWYILRTEENELIDARIKGKFRMEGIKTTNPLAVGDLVQYDIDGEDNYVIHTIENRKNYIIRKSVNLSKQAHIIAANMDFAMLIVTIANPKTSSGFIDRFLITAEAYHIETVLVFNKIDLLDDNSRAEMEYLIDLYSNIGYKCVRTSAVTGEGIAEINTLLKDKVTMLSGHSGAGKSSLIKAVDSTINPKIGDISEAHFKGKHTTTFAEMFPLSFGGDIIDTPGVKGFGLVDFEKSELNHYFVEMRAFLPNCKFNNCTHIEEPKCAVKEAVDNGYISEERYTNYLSLYFDEQDTHYRTSDFS